MFVDVTQTFHVSSEGVSAPINGDLHPIVMITQIKFFDCLCLTGPKVVCLHDITGPYTLPAQHVAKNNDVLPLHLPPPQAPIEMVSS